MHNIRCLGIFLYTRDKPTYLLHERTRCTNYVNIHSQLTGTSHCTQYMCGERERVGRKAQIRCCTRDRYSDQLTTTAAYDTFDIIQKLLIDG